MLREIGVIEGYDTRGWPQIPDEYLLRWPQERWVEPSAFEIPAAIAEAQPRLALDRRHSRGAPPFAVNA